MIVIGNENTQEQWVGNWDEFVMDNIASISWDTLTEIHERVSSGEVYQHHHGADSGWSIRKADTFPLHSVGHMLVDNGMGYPTFTVPDGEVHGDFDELMSFHVSNIEWGSGDDFTEMLSAEDKATIEEVSKSKLSKATALYIQEQGRQASENPKYKEEWR